MRMCSIGTDDGRLVIGGLRSEVRSARLVADGGGHMRRPSD